MNRFIIIDGNAILHRAYHAMPPLTTSKGELVNAIFGFTSILLKIFHDFHPKYAAVCFDKKAPTFRKKKYKEYQAKRPKIDEELIGQIERVHEVMRAMNIPIFELDGFEADDLIGTLVTQAVNFQKTQKTLNVRKSDNQITGDSEKTTSNISDLSESPNFRVSDFSEFSGKNSPEVIIVTGDRDLLQLVSDSVKVYLPVKGLSQSKLFDEAGVLAKMGVKPNQIPDLKGLIGDQSDNYPGVSGIGPKTALGLLGSFGSFRNIYKNLNKIPAGVTEKLRAGKKMGELSFELATIRRDVPVKLDLRKCKLTDYDFEEVSALFSELEFHSMIARLPKDIHEIEKPASADSFGEAKEEKKADQMGLF